MEEKKMLKIAIPVTLQSLLQSSFSVIDQVMTGQLGEASIAGIGLAGKFSSVFSVLLSAIAAAAGIVIAQYMGKRNRQEVSRGFSVHMALAIFLAVCFLLFCRLFPLQIMGAYTGDAVTRKIAAAYLQILAASYIPMAVGILFSTLLRCMEAAVWPLYASILAAAVNTGLNYVFIFGRLGLPRLGVKGAALATVISQYIGCLLILIFFFRLSKKRTEGPSFLLSLNREKRRQYLGILLPILACEFLWSLGENVYAAIYGHIGTDACAAMTLTAPVQVLFIGAMSGLSQAAGILLGKLLGEGKYEQAYKEGKKLMLYGLAGSVFLSVLLIALGSRYAEIYQVKSSVRGLTVQILVAFALVAPLKVENMILGGGIIRSGGRISYIMWIDFIGTWLFGVPLGLLSAFVWRFSIPYVYFLLSLEEGVRLILSLVVFQKRWWIKSLGEK